MIYIVAGNYQQSRLYAMNKLEPDDPWFWLRHPSEMLGRATLSKDRAVFFADWRKVPGIDDIEDMLTVRGMPIYLGKLWGKPTRITTASGVPPMR